MNRIDRRATRRRLAREFMEGFRSEGKVALGEARQVIGAARRAFDSDPEVRDAQRAAGRQALETVTSDPIGTARRVARSMAEPVQAELADGRTAAAAGRATVLLAGLVLPGAGAEKLARVTRDGAEPRDQAP